MQTDRDQDRGGKATPSLADGIARAFAQSQATRDAGALRVKLGRGCWIYGAGGYGRLVATLLSEQDIAVHGFIDRRGAGASSEDDCLPVVHPDAFDTSLAPGATLIVALHNFAAPQEPVVAWGEATGFADVLIPAELPDVLGARAGSYWLSGRADVTHHLGAIDRVAERLADAKSVSVLDGIARFRATGDIRAHPASHLPSQYFPDDVPLPREAIRLVDGGAYIGDSYTAGIAAGVTFAEWYAFEPDSANFEALIATAARATLERAALFPCGLGDRNHQIRFSSGQASGSHAAQDGAGDVTVQIVALDDVLHGIVPTYIKLDIEGAEREALAGMRRTLIDHRPSLAISVYHKPEDLWELPLLVHQLLPDAKLYLRQHGANGFDTVLYAVSSGGATDQRIAASGGSA